MVNKHRGEKAPRHVRLYHWMLNTSAWQTLGVVARSLYIELASRYHGLNNGQIIFSVRQAAKALKTSKDTAARAFEELQRFGFIVVQKKGGFNLKELKGQATEWRLTEFGCGSNPIATKDFAKWTEGNDFPVNKGSKPSNKRRSARYDLSINQKSIPMVNYKRPIAGTAVVDNSSFEFRDKDQIVESVRHKSQHRDWLVSFRPDHRSRHRDRVLN